MLLCRRLFCLFFLLLATFSLHAQTNFSTVVVFGDSLSDTGNFAHVTQSQYGIRYPSDSLALGFDYTDGRFTDGADTQPAAKAYFGVWAEQLAASLAGKPAIKDSLDGGTNYAYGEATTGDATTTIRTTFAGLPVSITVHNMGQQVTDYLGTNPTPNAQTLYILWGGANDLYADDSAVGVAAAAQRETALVQRLIDAGATNFLIPNLPPLGGVPQYATGSTASALNVAAAQFAAALAGDLAVLKMSATTKGTALNIYQPDIFTLFTTAATNPISIGLGNVSAAAQNIPGSPDTYLIWDGLHPTTTGHHYVAAAAANLLNSLVASTSTLTVPATVVAGGSATLTATVASSASATKPTGLVTFFSGGTAVASAALNASGIGTAVLTGLTAAASPLNITAVYAGDTTFNPSTSTAQPLTVLAAAVGTTTVVTSSSLSANLGASVTFTATVTPTVSTNGAASGTVTFLDGTQTLGTGALNNGVATYTTSALAAGTHTITASYAAAGVFGGSTSTAINEVITAPSFTAAASPNPLTITRGASGMATINITPSGGYGGMLTLACGTLPAHLSCSFSTTTFTINPLNNLVQAPPTLTVGTNASAALLLPARPGAMPEQRTFVAMLFSPAMAALWLLGVRRRKQGPACLGRLCLVLVLAAGAVMGVTGCGAASNDAASGTYTVPITVTPATGSAMTINLQVIVQ